MAGGWMALTAAATVAGFAAGWLARQGRRSVPEPAAPPGNTGEQLMELSTLAGGLAHEIRNPLSTLKVNLQLLGEDWRDENAPVADLRRRSLGRLATLQTEANRLHHIVEDFLRLVGRQELALVARDLNELVRELVDFYAPQACRNGLRLDAVLADSPLPCRLDADLFKQAMLNLCINAQDAMAQGGQLVVRTRREGPSPDGAGGACVEFADTGPGLGEDTLRRIFEPYYSTKPRGTGLGLALTRRIVHAHGGTITAASRPGQGTTFTITLPLAQGERS